MKVKTIRLSVSTHFGLIFLVLIASSAAAIAQNPYGRILGRVVDPSGAVVPGTDLTLMNLETGMNIKSASNDRGNYEFPGLIPGKYRIAAEAPGFKRSEHGPIQLQIGDILDIELRLEMGGTSEMVTVLAEAPLLQTADTSIGQVIDERRILELPMGSNVNYMVPFAPGVMSPTTPASPWAPTSRTTSSDFGVAGTKGGSSVFTLDGNPNMEYTQISFVPPSEAIQELRVQTVTMDASIGHVTGAAVDMVMKTGTNAFHGVLTYQHSNSALNARNFFTNRAIFDTSTGPVTEQKISRLAPPSHRHRERASLDGPVYLPHIYDGRNRTFWTFGLENTPLGGAGSQYSTVPTEKERNGDFSQLLALGGQYQIYDPATIAPAPNGRFSRRAFAGNIIPTSRLDSVAQKILKYIPLPNTSANATPDGQNNFVTGFMNVVRFRSYMARIDHAVSNKQRLYGSYSYQNSPSPSQAAYFGNDNPARGDAQTAVRRAFALNDVLSLRPDLVVNLSYGLTRMARTNFPVSKGFDLTQFGISSAVLNLIDPQFMHFPNFAFAQDGFTATGRAAGNVFTTTYHTLSGHVSKVQGNHTLRFGSEYRIYQNNVWQLGNLVPAYQFSPTYTRGPLDNSTVAPMGQGLASFLLSIPTGGGMDLNDSWAIQSGYLGLYFQDDWKVTKKLTVNLGIRYELELPVTDRYNRAIRGFDFSAVNPVQDAARGNYAKSPIPEVPLDQFRIPGGLLFAGVNGVPRALADIDAYNFGPRIGIAYRAFPKTVLRMGYGVFYSTMGADVNSVTQTGFSQRTPLVVSNDNGLTFPASITNPFPGGVLRAAGASAGLKTNLGRGTSFFLPTMVNPYVQRWTLSVQRELPRRFLMEGGYIGSRGTKLSMAESLSNVPAKYLSTSPVRDQKTIDFLSQQVQNPFYGLPDFAGTNLAAIRVPRSQLLAPYPHFTGVATNTNGGSSWYHAFYARVERRFARAYSIQGTYTWSKSMEAVEKLNPTDPAPTHVISDYDRPHRVSISALYDLPFGTTWLRVSSMWLRQIIAGWSLTAIYQYQSGPALGFGNVLFYGNIKDIALPGSRQTVERWFNTNAGFERNSQLQLASNIRTFPLRLNGVRGDGFNVLNVSLVKNFQIWEPLKLQLRAEAMDALNHPQFGSPVMDPTNSLFGQVQTSSGSRSITLIARLSW